MSESELGWYREALKTKQVELENRLRRRDEIVVERVPDVMDELKQAGEREFAIENLTRETALLTGVRDALLRIAEGSYGVCLNCGAEIGRARLAAVPWASHCIGCQGRMDRQLPYASKGRNVGEAA